MSLAIQNLFLSYKDNDNDNDDDNDSTCVLSKILIVRILTQVKLFSLFRGIPIGLLFNAMGDKLRSQL